VAQGVDQPVIMLTGHGTVDMCRRAFKAGAAEFLEKPVDDEALLEALQHAVRQHVRSRQRHAGGPRRRASALRNCRRASARCWALIVAGLTNKEIGRALGLSPRTVETHRANLFAKLGCGVAGAADPPATPQLVDEARPARPARRRPSPRSSTQAAA
jgi:two-component system response regulator FixJ